MGVKKPVKVDDDIKKSINLLNDIATKSNKIIAKAEEHLYERLRETYVIYYKWMEHKNKDEFFEELESYLVSKHIPYKSNTSEALLMTKAILGEENKGKASKYGKHMDTAYRKGITPKEYPAWMQENGVELVSRRQSRIKDAQKVKISNKGKYKRAVALIHTWLETREAKPLSTAGYNKRSIAKYKTLIEATKGNTEYELAICKRRKDENNNDVLDTLWLLPQTKSIEDTFMHYLAHAVVNDLDNLEQQMEQDQLAVLGTEIDQLMAEDEIYRFAFEDYERELNRKVSDAVVQGKDVGHVYASHTFIKPKIKSTVSIAKGAKTNGNAKKQTSKAIKLPTKTKANQKNREAA